MSQTEVPETKYALEAQVFVSQVCAAYADIDRHISVLNIIAGAKGYDSRRGNSSRFRTGNNGKPYVIKICYDDSLGFPG